ncbi:MAG: S53 family peptidase [Minisyncoccia bacterium]
MHILRAAFAIVLGVMPVQAAAIKTGTIDAFEARPPIHALAGTMTAPLGLTPSEVRAAYHLPASGGSGTVAIISAFHHPSLESDLSAFGAEFMLPGCTQADGCLEIHRMASGTKENAGWALESALDTEWAHAIAPSAKLLVVEAGSAKGGDLMKAVDYARGRPDVVAVSMSWGGDEFSGETKLDGHFRAANSSPNRPMAFFASSGDDGAGASWPAVSLNVVAVGGTTLDISKKPVSERAWAGSGGGVSAYESEPPYQRGYSIPRSTGKRAIPDVAYAADPDHGFSVYHAKRWYVVGGTSAGAPQWAAIEALGRSVTPERLYADKAGPAPGDYFRDIKSGSNGACAYYCEARARYDYVTGLGSPVTYRF